MTTTITRSPRTRATLRTNYYPNPANANPSSGLHASATAYATGSAAGTYAIATGNFQQLTTTALPAGSRFGYYMDVLVNAPAGTQVAAALFFQLRTGPAPIRFWIDCYSSTGVQVGHADTISSAAGGTLNLGVTTTDAITRIRYYVFFENQTAAAMAASSIQLARYVVELGVPVAGPFFWGGQAASGTTTYGWLGTVSNSPSILVDNNPADIFTPALMTSLSASRAGKNTVIDIPGSSLPSVVLHPTSGRRGKMTFLLGTESAAVAFDALMKQQAGFVLVDTDRAIAGMAFNLDSGGYSYELDMDTQEQFTGEVSFVEVFS